jgi:peptidoglycan/LPS O-acetylase OafA/YrhL
MSRNDQHCIGDFDQASESCGRKVLFVTLRNQSLDVLRGVAILLVLGGHSNYPCVSFWRAIGGSGVELFFVLSGFLISGLLFSEYRRTGHIAITRFWIRRAFKIYPGFYVLLAVTTAILALSKQPEIMLGRAVFFNIIFVQNYVPSAGIIPQSWSLAVEEHFYFVLPLLLWLLARRRTVNPFRSIPFIVLASIPICWYLRYCGDWNTYSQTHLRIDALLAGVGLSYWKHFARRGFPRTSKLPYLTLSLAILAPAFWIAVHGQPGSLAYTFRFLGFGALLLWAEPRHVSMFPLTRFIAWVGRYSYSIYLWHMGATGLPYFIFGNTFPGLAAYLISAVVLGVAMAKLIEIPCMKLRDRLVPSLARTLKPVHKTAFVGSPEPAYRMP